MEVGREADGCTPTRNPEFDQPRSVLAWLLFHLPRENAVFPSERYYYYTFRIGARRVSGNLRFVDIERGIVYMGYFDQDERDSVRTATWRCGDGVDVRYDLASRTATLTCDGLTRDFRLDRSWDCFPSRLVLRPEEKFVSGVLDESGYYLSLIFHNLTDSFYYVLNEDMPLPESVLPFDPPYADFQIGSQSRFVFFKDPGSGRRILVGVDREHVRMNSYFDGPFDQVPPDLDIGDMVTRSYPYVKYRGGVDKHGNFAGVDAQRIAISPYQVYGSLRDLLPTLEWLRLCATSEEPAWILMVREWKRDFVPPPRLISAESLPPSHDSTRSKGWPANHWRAASDGWAADHAPAVSLGWAPQHDAGTSGSSGTDGGALPQPN